MPAHVVFQYFIFCSFDSESAAHILCSVHAIITTYATEKYIDSDQELMCDTNCSVHISVKFCTPEEMCGIVTGRKALFSYHHSSLL